MSASLRIVCLAYRFRYASATFSIFLGIPFSIACMVGSLDLFGTLGMLLQWEGLGAQCYICSVLVVAGLAVVYG